MRLLRLASASIVVASATLALAGGAAAAIHSNPASITINDADPDTQEPGTATPYPSTISVLGESGTITDVNVTLTGFSHTFTSDIGILLVGPTGVAVELIDGVGGANEATDLNFTFNDAATDFLSCDEALASGSYKPTDCFPTFDDYPSPAPAGPHGELLSAFNGTSPNGTWSLYVVDFVPGDVGTISGGWSINIHTSPLAVTMAGLSARPAKDGVLVRWRTGSELDFLGFRVYRSQGQAWRRISGSLIAARGGAVGAAYRFLDRTARRGATYRYRIQAVNLDGTREWFGPVRVRLPR